MEQAAISNSVSRNFEVFYGAAGNGNFLCRVYAAVS